jgi:hypothetical protein
MPATQTTLGLDECLPPPWPPANLRFRNLITTRTVMLGELLKVAHLERVRLLPGDEWDFPLWLVVAGEDSVVAQVGLSVKLLPALGIAPGLSLPELSAMATQMLSPLLPSLRQLFKQDVDVRVENAEGGAADTSRWAKFMLWPITMPVAMPCRVHEAYAQKLGDLASTIPRSGHDQTRVPLFLGAQQRLTLAELRRLQVGDVIVVEDAQAPRLDLRIDASAQVPASPRLAVVSDSDGRVEHLSPGAWHELQPKFGGAEGSPAIAVDIVVGRMTLRAYQCRQLALGECVVDWASVAWLEEVQLRASGRTFGTARAVMVAGVQGYEVTRLSSGTP